MAQSRWDAFQNVWRGACCGLLLGMVMGVWIADKPGCKWFAGAVSGVLVLVAMIPDLLSQIARGVRRYRSVPRD